MSKCPEIVLRNNIAIPRKQPLIEYVLPVCVYEGPVVVEWQPPNTWDVVSSVN